MHFFSSSSVRMAQHFKSVAKHICQMLSSTDPFVIEIGSNDGIMLEHIAQRKIRHVGIEPSANVALSAQEKGINTLHTFFNSESGAHILSEYGQADVIYAANVMCHIPGICSVFENITRLLKPKGQFVFEDPYWGDILNKTSYDQIYDEHIFYFTARSIQYLAGKYGLEIIHIESLPVHGGSMRYYLAHQGHFLPSNAVDKYIQEEKSRNFQSLVLARDFSARVRESRTNLSSLLQNLKQEGKRVVGYAATSKSTTVTNYCKITPDLLEYISDTTPLKHNKFSPGTHVPIKPYSEFCSDYPDYALLFGWNHSQEIFEKEKDFRESGGKWIVYVPRVEVI